MFFQDDHFFLSRIRKMFRALSTLWVMNVRHIWACAVIRIFQPLTHWARLARQLILQKKQTKKHEKEQKCN